jgi:hypothetical protein
MERYAVPDPINMATGKATSVNDLVKMICGIAVHPDVKFLHNLRKRSGLKVKLGLATLISLEMG